MSRTKSQAPSTGSAQSSRATKTKGAAVAPADEKLRSRGRRRALVLAVLGVVAVLAAGGRELWQWAAPLVVGRERYLLPADRITITKLPEWISGDVRGQVIRDAGLDRRLSILDPQFATIIESAFRLHPWVASVGRIEKRYPPGVHVELVYRRPVAAIEIPDGDGYKLLPVDEQGVHLPAADVPAIRLLYLPRLTGVVNPPPPGQRWDDPRVAGGVELAARLADEWERLHLLEIVPSARPEIQGDRRYFVYDLRSGGGTQIVWGAPPHETVPGEDDFATKLERLKQCAMQYGPLDSVNAPKTIDIRRGVVVAPREAKKSPPEGEGETVVK